MDRDIKALKVCIEQIYQLLMPSARHRSLNAKCIRCGCENYKLALVWRRAERFLPWASDGKERSHLTNTCCGKVYSHLSFRSVAVINIHLINFQKSFWALWTRERDLYWRKTPRQQTGKTLQNIAARIYLKESREKEKRYQTERVLKLDTDITIGRNLWENNKQPEYSSKNNCALFFKLFMKGDFCAVSISSLWFRYRRSTFADSFRFPSSVHITFSQ